MEPTESLKMLTVHPPAFAVDVVGCRYGQKTCSIVHRNRFAA